MRIGYELSYANNITRPTNLRTDTSPSIPMSAMEKIYLRIFGMPDTIKQQQAREILSIIKKISFKSICARAR